MSYENARVAVITGASSGIGRATALKFAHEGWNLALGARRKDALQSLVAECRHFDVQSVAVETDIADEDAVDNLADTAIGKFGHFDVWINGAGVVTVGVFDRVPLEEHRRVIETNLLGTMYGCRVALRHFRQRGRGVIINISSVLGKSSHPYESSYVASKHGVTALGISLRQELWLQNEDKIHVCTVHPESTDTPFFEHAANHTGHQVKPVPPVDPPETVAGIIYGVALQPAGNEDVIVGRGGKIISGMTRVAQELASRQTAFMSARRQFDRGKHVREHSGTLFQPMKSGAGVHGSRKEPEPAGIGTKVLAIVGILAPVGAAAYVLSRKRHTEAEEAA